MRLFCMCLQNGRWVGRSEEDGNALETTVLQGTEFSGKGPRTQDRTC